MLLHPDIVTGEERSWVRSLVLGRQIGSLPTSLNRLADSHAGIAYASRVCHIEYFLPIRTRVSAPFAVSEHVDCVKLLALA